MNTGYKIVNMKGNKYYSCMVFMGKGRIEYKINEWVYPLKKFGSLAIFDTLNNANGFLNENLLYNDTLCIFKCEYEHGYLPLFCMRGKEKAVPLFKLPEGTKFASKVKLIEKVTRITL